MARFRRLAALALTALLSLAPGARAQEAQEALPLGFHDRPVLVVDPGRHTAPIRRADADAAGRLAATASHDKTVRLWSLADGAQLHAIRLPAGPGNVGRISAVALDPAGALVAAGGWTAPQPPEAIYLYDTATYALRHRIPGLPEVVLHLAFSRDGRYLAATLGGGHGLRVFDRERGWAEAMRDADYGGSSYGAAFAPDGRLATTSDDGQVRLYPRDLALPPLRLRAPGGERPLGVAFGAEGARLAVGYDGAARVDVLDGRSLAPLHPAATGGVDNGDLGLVAWAADGTLLAGGRYWDGTGRSVLTWASEGRGARRSLPAGQTTVAGLVPLSGGDLLVAAGDPFLARLAPDGRAAWTRPSPLADFRGQRSILRVSADGGVVEFEYAQGGRDPARFDLGRLALEVGAGPDPRTAPPRQQGLPIAGWDWVDAYEPTLEGAPLPLDRFERSRSLALHPDGGRFVLGAEWSLRAFDARGAPRWRQPVPGTAWAVNVTGDGRLVVAAYGDGTIRWHRMDDGREILAFMPLPDRPNWVAWTPESVYAASPGGHGVLHWHENQPDWQPAASFPVRDIPGAYRPEAIKLVLREMETARALGIDDLARLRREVRLRTRSGVPPGARLHLLAIGVGRYDAAHLRLNFAQQDAHDVVSALTSTQEALWVAGSRQYLADADAGRAAIRRGLDTLRNAMTGKDDLAVVHFSGHGAMVDGELYLLPRDVQAGDAVALKDSALPIAAFRAEMMRIAERGRVLVLLDACYSGGASLDGHAKEVPSAVLSTALAAANISVLTSSSASQASREDPRWGNGAFTEAFLEALGAADTNHDGLISATELAAYLDRRVRALTDGKQTPAMEVRFDGTLFVVR